MTATTALDRLKAWHTRGAILANNHTLDFGPDALAAEDIACVGDGDAWTSARSDWPRRATCSIRPLRRKTGSPRA